ncbi:MAG: hypothetical protein AAF320_02960 [Myxococcota bacterium]
MNNKKNILATAGCLLLLYGIGCSQEPEDNTDLTPEQQEQIEDQNEVSDPSGKSDKKKSKKSLKTGSFSKGEPDKLKKASKTGKNKKKKTKKIIPPGAKGCVPVADVNAGCDTRTATGQVACNASGGICDWKVTSCTPKNFGAKNICEKKHRSGVVCQAMIVRGFNPKTRVCESNFTSCTVRTIPQGFNPAAVCNAALAHGSCDTLTYGSKAKPVGHLCDATNTCVADTTADANALCAAAIATCGTGDTENLCELR